MIRAYRYYIDSFRGLSNEIWLLALISLVNRAGTMVLPFLSIYLTDQLGFGFREAGIAMSVFGIGSLIGTYLGGKVADLYGYYEAMFWSLISGGLIFFAFLVVSSFYMVCLVVLLASSFGEAYRPAMMASIAIYSKDANRTRSIALIRLAVNLGYALGPAIGGLLAAGVGYNSLFIIDGLTCLMAGFLLKSVLKEKTKSSQAVEKRQILPEELAPWKDKEYLAFLLACTLCALVFMQLFYTAPVYFKNNLSLDEDVIGILLAVNALIIALVEMPIIRSLENKWSPVLLISFGCALFALGYLFMAPWQLLITAILYIVFITFGEIFSFPYASQLAMELSQKRRAEYLAYFSMSFSIAHILAPSLGLSIAESMGFSFLWLVSGILSILVCILFYFSGLKLQARRK